MADTPLRATADPWWQDTQAVAQAHEEAVRRAFLAAIALLAAGATLEAVRRALALGDPTSALAAIPLDLLPGYLAEMATAIEATATDASRDALTRTLTRVATGTPVTMGLTLTGGLPTEELRQWARSYAAQLVVDLTEETRRALRQLIESAVGTGQSPARLATLIVDAIGLTRRQAAALARYRAGLIADGLGIDRVERLAARYAARALKLRARAIARTETITAANAANRAVWERNVREGLIDPNRWMREWIAIIPSDGRTCPDCADLDGQRVRIGAPYISPAYGEVWGPALHPQCRCSEALVRA